MLTKYIEAAMRHARCERLPDSGSWYCEIPECPGVWSDAPDHESALDELQSVLEDWIAFALMSHDPLPTIDGIQIIVDRVA